MKQITAIELTKFLADNHDYIEQNEEFLLPLVLSYLTKFDGKSALFSKQIAVLRNQINELDEQLYNCYEQAKTNDLLFRITTFIILDIIKVNNIDELNDNFTSYLNNNKVNNYKSINFNLNISSTFTKELKKFPKIIKVLQDFNEDVKSLYNYFDYNELCFLLKKDFIEHENMTFNDNKQSAVMLSPIKHNNDIIGLFALGTIRPDGLAQTESSMFFDFIVDALNIKINKLLN